MKRTIGVEGKLRNKVTMYLKIRDIAIKMAKRATILKTRNMLKKEGNRNQANPKAKAVINIYRTEKW